MAADLPPVNVSARREAPGARMRVYQPQCKVTLVKTSRRSSLGNTAGVSGTSLAPAARVGSFASLDLTPFLSEQGGLRTQKSVRGAAGGFSLMLEDRPVLGDSLYGLIEPQDIVEIRIARVATGKLPLVMRGLVSSVSRSFDISTGTPAKMVMVTGMDFGKVLEQLRIDYLPGSVTGELWLDQFKFFRKFNADAKIMQANDFLSLVCEKVLSPYLATMLDLVDGSGLQVAIPTAFKAEGSIRGLVSPIGISAVVDVSVYQLLSQFLDVGPFNELFVDDRETEVAVVCRPAPWQNLAGNYIDPMAAAETALVSDGDLMSISSARSDAGVANYFWVDSGRWSLQNNGTLQQMALGSASNYIRTSYVNSNIELYGLRKMQVETQLGNPLQMGGMGVSADAAPGDRKSFEDWLSDRRDFLAASNLDNVVLESGSMRIKGDETIRPGSYVSLRRGATRSTMYAVSVSQEFIPATGFFTSIDYERGTGFVDRQQSAAAPWVAERDEGGAA